MRGSRHACFARTIPVLSELKTNIQTLDLSEGCVRYRVVCSNVFPKDISEVSKIKF